jgi:hypothetical protein
VVLVREKESRESARGGGEGKRKKEEGKGMQSRTVSSGPFILYF